MKKNSKDRKTTVPVCHRASHYYMSGGDTLLVSFSGGLTSAYMSFYLKMHCKSDMVFIFANTGQENEKTLSFVDNVDKEFGLNVVWLEAEVKADGIGTKYKIVNFETASRDGGPFEAVIGKYGISNKSYPHCTRELKMAPIHSYMKEHYGNDYITAIGIRADEYRRCGNDQKIVYPLASEWIVSKDDVNRFWGKMPFTLGLEDYQGNCRWCWKKSLKKHFRLIDDDQSIFDFPRDMERKYGKVRCPVGKRVFFRGNKSTNDLFEMKKGGIKQPSLVDVDEGCSESCEMY